MGSRACRISRLIGVYVERAVQTPARAASGSSCRGRSRGAGRPGSICRISQGSPSLSCVAVSAGTSAGVVRRQRGVVGAAVEAVAAREQASFATIENRRVHLVPFSRDHLARCLSLPCAIVIEIPLLCRFRACC